ncbi:MAG: hypothetical protein JRJ39_17220 [Deltaproteobacteria bacterium]|nr:hypothetical protein [Deltaproteobacteria bacterium]MBW2181191.1 hypothetical protein [Deltaproteobacteria bacterium]MBW2366187.1 hypothetical protein [Deltaproteobacteria bacterium]
MSLKNEFKIMVTELSKKFTLPLISNIFFPPFHKGGQPKDTHFMALRLESGAVGISFVLPPDEKIEQYNTLKLSDFIGKDPCGFALEFGSEDPIKEMISLAAVNAICQHIMRETNFTVESAVDSLGLLSISAGDRIGMVGLFSGLVETIRNADAELVIVEKQERLIKKYPNLPITLDATKLRACNKILCTSATILNNSLDEILTHCSSDSFISIIGPTAGYFPDPLFARGVDVVGGRVVKNGSHFMRLLAEGKHWGNTTQKTCFQRKTYASII